ncbi:GrpB family protein [Nocardioides sp.]|uniref:GrpB family protein n=1 Tax=Nocardioides sp. TaxID=35761 RepID=UPI00286B72D3|nr:GrpB family protein [Nocardioides sp.]
MIEVTSYDAAWPATFARIAGDLRAALAAIPSATVEHVGSTSVPGLAAKPIIDVDVIVPEHDVTAAVEALVAIGYVHRGDLGVPDREAFRPPDAEPRRNVYVCTAGSLNVRNHVAVRDVLRRRADLRDAYAAVKRSLADEGGLDVATYTARKSEVLQQVLAASDLTGDERRRIWQLNDPSVTFPTA